MEPTKEQIEKAVKFWGENLGNTLMNSQMPRPMAMRFALDSMAAADGCSTHVNNVTPDTRVRFREELRRVLEHYRETRDYRQLGDCNSILLEVDRRAEGLLAEAVTAAGLDRRDASLFPVKTFVCLLQGGKIFAREGDAGKRREL